MAVDPFAELERRVRALEGIAALASVIEAEVVDNADPDNLGRVKVKAEGIWGDSVSPWCIDETTTGGDGYGTVETPAVGDMVAIKLLNGNPDAPVYTGSPRSEVNTIPSEFEDPNVNGQKTQSGIVICRNDNDGSYYVEVPAGAKVYLTGDGEVITTGVTKLNEGEVNIALGGPTIICPVTGNPIPSSLTCFAKRT